LNFTLDLNTLLQGIVILLCVAGVKGIFSLNSKVSTICARLGKIETWQTGHEKIDDERHTETTKSVTSIWDRLDKMIG